MENKKGFTLVVVLLVIVLIAILAAIVIVAINPGRQIRMVNDTQRKADIKALMDAVDQYKIDHRGDLPSDPGPPQIEIPIGFGFPDSFQIASIDDVSYINLCPALVPDYLPSMPFDPVYGYNDDTLGPCTDYDTVYTIFRDMLTHRITIFAPVDGPDLNGETIQITR